MNYLFLHGLAGDPQNWERTMLSLTKEGHKCFAPSIPYLEGRFSTLTELATALRAAIPPKYLSENSIIVGNSLGGTLALELGNKSPLIALVASYTTSSTQWIGRGIETLNREIDRLFFDRGVLNQRQLDQYIGLWKTITSSAEKIRALRRIKKAATSYDMESRYSALQDRLLLVCGSHDNISPLRIFHELVATHPRIRIETIQDCGHAIPLEKPLELAEILDRGGRHVA